MIAYKQNEGCRIYSELDDQQNEYWFDFKREKFLHNIDTFYYSVKFQNDFTNYSTDEAVLKFRNRFSILKNKLSGSYDEHLLYYVKDCGNLLLLPLSFAGFYNIWLQAPEEFDIVFAPSVPRGSQGVSVTAECVVQLRSYMIWTYGIHEAFERSYKYVESIAREFGLTISYVQENRADYCWHSNYFMNPEKFFNPENFYKMRVDRYKDASFHTVKKGTEGYDLDYISLGRRGQKCFVRIYLKTKEVIEMAYKSFFFKIWLFHGLINRYDLYCYEAAYKQKSFQYLQIARLQWYIEYGSDDLIKERCQYIIDQYDKYSLVGDDIRSFADSITPKLNMIVNVEFQTMRKGSKSYCLVPFRDNSAKNECKRIYDYLDNHAIIAEYLTHNTLRLVVGPDKNKSRREDCPFWKALRRTKLIDVEKNKHNLKLARDYQHDLNADVVKKRFINTAVNLSFYLNGRNDQSTQLDLLDAINVLNDNDLQNAMKYKKKRYAHLSSDFDNIDFTFAGGDLCLVNSSGEIIDKDYVGSIFEDGA